MRSIRFLWLALALWTIPAAADAAACSLTTLSVGPPKVVACTDTTATTITVPSNWTVGNTKAEVIGAGGGGSYIDSGGGGGGGGYSAALVALTPGSSIGIQVGAAPVPTVGQPTTTGVGAGQDTYLCNATSNCASISGAAVVVGAKGGEDVHATGGQSTMPQGGAGGAASAGIGSTKYSGGHGGRGPQGINQISVGGGGGAAGPFGNGGAGGEGNQTCGDESGPTCGNGGGGGGGGGSDGQPGGNPAAPYDTRGGNGGQNHLGSGAGLGYSEALVHPTAGTTGGGGGGSSADENNTLTPPIYTGAPGGNGTEWDATHGSGGGGGADISFMRDVPLGAGGLYGGGSGGGNSAAAAQGIIVLTEPTSTPGYGLLLGR